MAVPNPADYGLTLALIASTAKARRYSPHTYVAKLPVPPVDDTWAIEWIKMAEEAGYDVGKPRDTIVKSEDRPTRV